MPCCDECGNMVARRRKCPGCEKMFCTACMIPHSEGFNLSYIPRDLQTTAWGLILRLLDLAPPSNSVADRNMVVSGMLSILGGYLAGTSKPRPAYVTSLMVELTSCKKQILREAGAMVRQMAEGGEIEPAPDDDPSESPAKETVH